MNSIFFLLDPSRSWSPDSCVTISRIAKHCYEKLLNKLRSQFYDDADIIVSSFHLQSSPRNNLVLALRNGLHRCLKKVTDSEQHRYATTQVQEYFVISYDVLGGVSILQCSCRALFLTHINAFSVYIRN